MIVKISLYYIGFAMINPTVQHVITDEILSGIETGFDYDDIRGFRILRQAGAIIDKQGAKPLPLRIPRAVWCIVIVMPIIRNAMPVTLQIRTEIASAPVGIPFVIITEPVVTCRLVNEMNLMSESMRYEHQKADHPSQEPDCISHDSLLSLH
jgi:hypothetical protein